MANAIADDLDYFSRTFALWLEDSAEDLDSLADGVFDEFAQPLDAAAETLPLMWLTPPLLDAAAEEWWGAQAA
jgi:hypothetical protein